MGKSNRLITLDYGVNEKLKKVDNASGLIEELLQNNFNAHLSNDLDFLNKQVEEMDVKINSLQFNRASMTDRIRILNKKAQSSQEVENAKIAIVNKNKKLTKWIATKVKSNEITFDDYKNIKNLDNWADCVDAVISGSLELSVLIEKAKPKQQ